MSSSFDSPSPPRIPSVSSLFCCGRRSPWPDRRSSAPVRTCPLPLLPWPPHARPPPRRATRPAPCPRSLHPWLQPRRPKLTAARRALGRHGCDLELLCVCAYYCRLADVGGASMPLLPTALLRRCCWLMSHCLPQSLSLLLPAALHRPRTAHPRVPACSCPWPLPCELMAVAGRSRRVPVRMHNHAEAGWAMSSAQQDGPVLITN